MNRLFMILGGAVLIAVFGFALLGVSVNAQDAAEVESTGTVSDYFEQMWNAVAEKLGVERSELDSAVEDARADVAAKAVEDGKLTQEQADRMKDRPFGDHPFGHSQFGMRSKMHGLWGGKSGCAGVGGADIAEDLGLTSDELAAELEAGKSIDDIAEAQGVDLQAIAIEEKTAQILQAVEDGKLTQEQADWMIDGLEQGLMNGMHDSGACGAHPGCDGGDHGFGGFGRGGFDHGKFHGKGFWFDRQQGEQDEQSVPSNLSNS